MIRHSIALAILILILLASRLHAANADPGHWIYHVFAAGVQVKAYEDGSGVATEPETSTSLSFCIVGDRCDNTPISEKHEPAMVASDATDRIEGMFAPQIVDIEVWPDGSGFATDPKRGDIKFCVRGMVCDKVPGLDAYSYFIYLPTLNQENMVTAPSK